MRTATSKKTKAQAIAEFNNLQIPSSLALQFVPLAGIPGTVAGSQGKGLNLDQL